MGTSHPILHKTFFKNMGMMMEKTYKKDTIEIKYRLPKIPEAMRLLPKLGLDSSLNSSLSEWEIAANMIECIEPFILSIKSEN